MQAGKGSIRQTAGRKEVTVLYQGLVLVVKEIASVMGPKCMVICIWVKRYIVKNMHTVSPSPLAARVQRAAHILLKPPNSPIPYINHPSLPAPQQEYGERQAMAEASQHELGEALAAAQRALAEEKTRHTELASQAATARQGAQTARRELQDYKDKATRILQVTKTTQSRVSEFTYTTT
jgi:hypothetical protein